VRDRELEKGEGDVHKTPLFPLRADTEDGVDVRESYVLSSQVVGDTMEGPG
jgi:hypothetical protein